MKIFTKEYRQNLFMDFEPPVNCASFYSPLYMVTTELRSSSPLPFWREEFRELNEAIFDRGSKSLFIKNNNYFEVRSYIKSKIVGLAIHQIISEAVADKLISDLGLKED